MKGVGCIIGLALGYKWLYKNVVLSRKLNRKKKDDNGYYGEVRSGEFNVG